MWVISGDGFGTLCHPLFICMSCSSGWMLLMNYDINWKKTILKERLLVLFIELRIRLAVECSQYTAVRPIPELRTDSTDLANWCSFFNGNDKRLHIKSKAMTSGALFLALRSHGPATNPPTVTSRKGYEEIWRKGHWPPVSPKKHRKTPFESFTFREVSIIKINQNHFHHYTLHLDELMNPWTSSFTGVIFP